MLYIVMLANLSAFYTIVQHNAIVAGNWLDLFRSGSSAFPAGVGLILTGIVNAQLSADMKARIDFRFGSAAVCGHTTNRASGDAEFVVVSEFLETTFEVIVFKREIAIEFDQIIP